MESAKILNYLVLAEISYYYAPFYLTISEYEGSWITLPQAIFLTILPAAGKIFLVFCSPQAKYFEYFARRRQNLLSILPTVGKIF